MASGSRDVLITGVGLASSLGMNTQEHVLHLAGGTHRHIVDEERFAPYSVHPMPVLDYAAQIPKKSDIKQMETWQRIGVYAAGLALSDAGAAGQADLLERMDLVVAAGSGERDIEVDTTVLDGLAQEAESTLLAKQLLPSALRPTLFLAQLSNMLAGNISIVHHITGSSRTFMGEEIAGLTAVENAWRRISAGQTDLVLVGGALNAEREDLLLGYELGHNLWRGPYAATWDRRHTGGGFIPGSMGVFLVLEARDHADARGATSYAQIESVVTDRCSRSPGKVTRSMIRLLNRLGGMLHSGPLAVFSGTSGVEPVTSEELDFLDFLPDWNVEPIVRSYGSQLGHGVEAHFPAGIALAALALRYGHLPATDDESGIERPFAGSIDRALLTCIGHWRGEGLALLKATG